MKFVSLHISLVILALSTLCSCSKNDPALNGDDSNSLVRFSAGISSGLNQNLTKAVTGGDYGFQTSSKLKLYATAKWTGHSPEVIARYVDATVSAVQGSTGHFYNTLTSTLYWDDFGAGDSNSEVISKGLSVYGVAIDGVSTAPAVADNGWTAFSCSVNANQASGNSASDLLVSNNVSGDNAYKYNKSTNNDNPAELQFYHAYSKVTLNFKKGNGFTSLAPTTIQLPNYYLSGVLNILTGAFSGQVAGNVTNLYKHATAADGYDLTYEALVIPGRNLNESAAALTFTVEGNNYKVLASEIYNKLADKVKYGVMKSGVNYILNITVNKAAVQLTASISNWDNVSAEFTPDNGESVTFTNNGVNFGNSFKLYLNATDKDNSAADNASVKSGYIASDSQSSVFNWDNTNSCYNSVTPLYWPSNSTYYHFRAVAPAGETVVEDSSNGDYVLAATKQTVGDDTYTDLVWGAPYLSSALSPALSPTSGAVSLHFEHMMSQVNIKVVSNSDIASEKVDLTTSPKVYFTNCSNTGKLRLSNGVIDTVDYANYPSTTLGAQSNSTTNGWDYLNVGVVPHSLNRGTGENQTTGIAIVASDGNVYKVKDLSVIKETSTGAYITKWESGKNYTYTFNLKKSGVETTVQIKDWTDVVADNQDVQIQ